jgi:hypothetical protein
MKTMHKLVIGAALAVAVSIMALAADTSAPKERVLRIQSGGHTIAEVHLLAPCKLLCSDSLTVSQSGDATYKAASGPNVSGVLLFDGGQVLHLSGNVEFAGKIDDLGLHKK